VNAWKSKDESDATSTCVISDSKKTRDALAKHFQAAGLDALVIDETQNSSAKQGTTHFATMHRAKGLEFDRVIVLTPKAYLGDPLETDSRRKLIYVALTRAKKEAALLIR
jgi:superfamily I DNA/RNA helicase